MKTVLAFFIAALFVCGEARYFGPTDLGYNQESWLSNPNVAYSNRIINGEPADIANFPHMLALLNLAFGGFWCGASIISSQWVLSAAHCLHNNVPPHQINFRAGSTNRQTGGTVYVSASYTLHPQYNRATLQFDVAVARTTVAMGGTNISPIPLPPSCDSICCTVCENVAVTTTGWGRDENGQFPINLVQLTKPVHEFNDCVRIWAGLRITVTDDMFCKAAFDNRDTCNGDSGSPLVTGTGASRLQVGVVSFGTNPCANGQAPSGNVRVEQPAVRSWITTMTGV